MTTNITTATAMEARRATNRITATTIGATIPLLLVELATTGLKAVVPEENQQQT